jgi:PAS domain-containing protein
MHEPHIQLRPQDGWPQRIGWFRFHFDDGHWVWSPNFERMHGYRPGTVVADGELALMHIHPDDYRYVAATLHSMRGTHHSFSSRHRILDTENRTHDVIMVGAPFYDRDGAPDGMQGFCFDMTPAVLGAPAPQSGYDRVAARLQMNADGGGSEKARDRVRAATQC